VPKYSPTQQRILALLSDGLPHAPRELVNCLNDNHPDVPNSNLSVYITSLRKALRPLGQDIILEWHGRKPTYRHVRVVSINDK
jgi:hypothetical protein